MPVGTAAAFMMRPTTAPSEHVEIVVVPLAGEREAEARLRTRDDLAVDQSLETGVALSLLLPALAFCRRCRRRPPLGSDRKKPRVREDRGSPDKDRRDWP
jgi:hypothetical protein